MITLTRTNSSNADYQTLVVDLDKDLAIRDGEIYREFYAQYNKSDDIKHVVVAYNGDEAVGIGAIKHYEEGVVEVKRMYVLPAHRGKGIAAMVLNDLEQWATELGYSKAILETGKKMPEAIALYGKNNYAITPNYGQYAGMPDSVCFEKVLV
ncbi:MAG: GNAT family N-acetyltransferase [Sphingobacteriales bacterium JAD_PAG50586_3]|nr:MAG: GNAT family N-acetyltransferase [Sphingobacteriales bacterium JAD_PAG50586_3]